MFHYRHRPMHKTVEYQRQDEAKSHNGCTFLSDSPSTSTSRSQDECHTDTSNHNDNDNERQSESKYSH